MSTREPRRFPWRPVLVLALLALLGVRGTYAYWTDQATVSGTDLTAGTVDVRLDGVDSIVSSTLAMAAMVPASSSAQVITVRNSGTVPLKYSVNAGLTGTDASTFASNSALRLSLVVGGTRSVASGSATCTGGTSLVSALGLGTTTSTEVLARRGPLAVSATETLCVQVTLDAAAPSLLQGKLASLSLSVVGSSDLS